MLDVVYESRILGQVYDGLNSTYIALITKIKKPKYFDDFSPISLCNIVYKVIYAIIASRIKPI